jgi:hypothetical protein
MAHRGGLFITVEDLIWYGLQVNFAECAFPNEAFDAVFVKNDFPVLYA